MHLEEQRNTLAEKFVPLRAAINDLIRTFDNRYPSGPDFLEQLDDLQNKISAADLTQLPQLEKTFHTLRLKALTANPLLTDQPILFVTRHQYRSHYHAIDTLFHTDEYNVDRNIPHSDLFQPPGAMKTIDFANNATVKTIVNVPNGIARDPQLHFDGNKLVFAMRRTVKEDYHIWQVNTDGSNLTQLTSAAGVSDFDPIYLPDDCIAFSSTRQPKYNMCSRDIAANIFKMEPDGANIHQITKNTLFDNHAELMEDGRILYARWEYVDRNFGDAHGLWTVNPDGTNQAVYWGNNTTVPGAVFNPHEIPGTQRILCILGPHHDRLWGAMAIIDRRIGLDGPSPVLRTWPEDAAKPIRTGGAFDCDLHARTVSLKYEDPWPLSDKYFLCSRMIGKGEQTGIYLVDLFGNELLLHTEAPGCYDPMPLKPCKRPPVIAPRRDFQNKYGYFFVADVYRGTHMRNVKRGEVKFLRVVESPEKRHWSRGSWNGQGYTAPAMNWHSLENKRILGTVPVEQDGSAYFQVPAEKFVYFQLLDENGMMIQSMRSGTLVQPGEHTGCIGCHDNRLTSPAATKATTPLAMKKPPRKLKPWHGESEEFGFAAQVQPVFDKHCTSCHDYGKDAGKKLNLAPDKTLVFNTAYMELWRKGYIKCIGAGPAELLPARSWGSHQSKLISQIRNPAIPQHKDIELAKHELDKLITWLDLNGVYYPTYACAYPESRTGRTPINNDQLNRLSQLTKKNLGSMMSYSSNPGPQVSFDRPPLSPCLAEIKRTSPQKYEQALAIIQAGKEMLQKRPRADMPNFQPCQTDRKRQQKYELREKIELRNRNAINNGAKAYD